MPYVHQVLKELNQTHRLYVITNGFIQTQTQRLSSSGLAQYLRKAFISEKIVNNSDIKPKYTIHSLKKLLEIV